MSDLPADLPTSRPPEVSPAQPIASPVQVEFSAGNEPRWYLPTFTETLALMRWRLLYFLPAVLIFVVLMLLPVFPVFLQLLLWWKIILLLVALPVGAALNSAKHALRLRTEPFCIHCGYGLTGLPDGHICPECGNRFHLATLDDYRRDPHWFIKRYKIRHSHPATTPFAAGAARSRKRRDGT